MFLFIPSTTFFVLTQEKQEQAKDWGAECDRLRCVKVARFAVALPWKSYVF